MASRCQICEDVLSKVYGEEWVETARAKKTTESRDDPLQPETPLGHHRHTTNPYKLCCSRGVKLWDIIVYRHFWEWNKL